MFPVMFSPPGNCFNSRLREEATCCSYLYRRPSRGFNSRLREEATGVPRRLCGCLRGVSTHASVRRRPIFSPSSPPRRSFNSRLREEATSTPRRPTRGRRFQLTPP